MFLFSRNGDHRDLHLRTHSFPARRSSDLNAAPAHRLQMGDKTARRRQVRPAEAPEAVERRNAEKLLQPRFGPDAVEIASTPRSAEHTSELQSLMRISSAVFCLKKKKNSDSPTTCNHKPSHDK